MTFICNISSFFINITFTLKFKCVIGHGYIGMTVLIKRHSIIHHLDGNTLDTPLKLTITTFQVKDALLQAEGHSVIEIDDTVK